MKYKCVVPLVKPNHFAYLFGDEIDHYTWSQLTPVEKNHFIKLKLDFVPQKKKWDDDSYDSKTQIIETHSEDFIRDFWSPSESPIDNSSSNDSDTSSFDYGGGESGGGGSTGDW